MVHLLLLILHAVILPNCLVSLESFLVVGSLEFSTEAIMLSGKRSFYFFRANPFTFYIFFSPNCFGSNFQYWASLVAQLVKNLPTVRET